MIKLKFVNTCVLVTSVAASSLFLSACSSVPKSDARLDAAHATYNSLQVKGGSETVAPIEMKDAQDALSRADEALKQRKDAEQIDQKVYLAQQRVSVAEQAYRRKDAEQALKQINDNRDKERLVARTTEADSAKAQLQDAQAQLKDLQAKKTDRGLVMTLGDVLFDTGKSTLKSGGLRSLDKLAAFMNANPDRKVAIEGFTDSVGSDEMNQTLSEHRADAVKVALVNAGIGSDRITTRGYGEEYPVAGNDSASGRQLNRRVEIVLSDEAGNIAPR
jgi:outer membrane protein OmpA-like peptidoglycan-associated protein